MLKDHPYLSAFLILIIVSWIVGLIALYINKNKTETVLIK